MILSMKCQNALRLIKRARICSNRGVVSVITNVVVLNDLVITLNGRYGESKGAYYVPLGRRQ